MTWSEDNVPGTSTPERRAKRARYQANKRRYARSANGMRQDVARMIQRGGSALDIADQIHRLYVDRGFTAETAAAS